MMTIATLFDDPATGVAAEAGGSEPKGAGKSNGAAGAAEGGATGAAGIVAGGASGAAAGGPAGTAACAAGGVGLGAGFDVEGLVGLFSSDLLVRGLADRELEARLVLVGRCESRLVAVKAEMVAELTRRRGEGHAADVLRDGLKQSRGRAKQDVKLAEQLGRAPGTAEALRSGLSLRSRRR